MILSNFFISPIALFSFKYLISYYVLGTGQGTWDTHVTRQLETFSDIQPTRGAVEEINHVLGVSIQINIILERSIVIKCSGV